MSSQIQARLVLFIRTRTLTPAAELENKRATPLGSGTDAVAGISNLSWVAA
jgi:hypothetical protein